ncbi:ABC transporter substrate-binding protein [Paenibacillus lemnae]|uniref:Extracellular solute-binding protein n=1 Tax=Paenibacillus lemnae TaxID=1330551 RepID=A0A848M478_PAELE|nr:extracellular solute-binding protein [Paenibacillus lemnae]NMO94613.1 extracellular solute-binding protein [Paenibacillus lemnae]
MKKTHMKKMGLLSFVIVLVFALLTGCTGSGSAPADGGKAAEGNNNTKSDPAPGNSGGEAAATDTIDEPVTIVITNGGGSSNEQNDATFGNAIREKFPNVTIEYKGVTSERRIEHLILDGENIDLFVQSIGGFFNTVPVNDFQYDLTELVEKYDVDLSRIDPSMIDSMKANANGELWGVPFQNTNLVIYYNKDIFDKFGVDYPTNGMTWEEMYDLAKQFNQTRDGADYVGLALSGHHHIKLNNFGLSYVDPETQLSTYDDEKWKSVFDVLYTPAQDPGYRAFMAKKENLVADSQDFYDGKAAMLGSIQHHTGNPNFQRADFNWDMVSYPTYKENPGVGSQAYPTYLAIPSFAKNKDAAMKIIKYLISDEFQMEASKAGVMPVLSNPEVQKVYGTAEYQGKNLEAAFFNEFAPVMYKTIYDNDVEKASTQFITDLALGNMDINTALRQAKEQGDKKIAEKKQ